MSKQLIERADPSIDVFRLAISDALEVAGLREGDSYYVRVSVIELVDPDDVAA